MDDRLVHNNGGSAGDGILSLLNNFKPHLVKYVSLPQTIP